MTTTLTVIAVGWGPGEGTIQESLGSWPSGHVAVSVNNAVYEQTWTGGWGLFTSQSGPNDGIIKERTAEGPVFTLATYVVSDAQGETALQYINGRLGVNNYGLFDQSCLTFVDGAMQAAGISGRDWRLQSIHYGYNFPGAWPIEFLSDPTLGDIYSLHRDVMLEGLIDSMYPYPTRCFPADTPIAISPTQTRPIVDIRVGDTVLAFDPVADLGRGALVPRRVVRLYRNTTQEWVKLTWSEGGEAKELIATPGHHFLDQFGNFPTIEAMLENNRTTVVLASGAITEVTAKRISYSADTAHLFEQAQARNIQKELAA